MSSNHAQKAKRWTNIPQNPIMAEGFSVFDSTNILSKKKFLSTFEFKFFSSSKDDQMAIYNVLFLFSRDPSPLIRVKALSILNSIGIPTSFVLETLSKQEKNFSSPNSMHVGTMEVCLEDPYPEVRVESIKLLASTIKTPDDKHSQQVITAITQMTNDTSPKVRSEAIHALSNACRILNHLITLEDNQLRVILPIIVESGSTPEEKQNVLDCISQLKAISTSQTQKVLDELSNAARRFNRERVNFTAYAFGVNNFYFMRIVADRFLKSRSTITNEIDLVKPENFAKIISILSACQQSPFPLPEYLQKYAFCFTPILAYYEKMRKESFQPKIENRFVDLDRLKRLTENSILNVRQIVKEDEAMKDAVELMLLKKSPNGFLVQQFNENTFTVSKYVCTLKSPESNTKLTPARQFLQNFTIPFIGKISPLPPPDYKFVIVIDVPLHQLNPPYQQIRLEIPIDNNGEFNYHPSLSFPVFNPYCIIHIYTNLITPENEEININEKPVEMWFKVY
ncbi:hypothetical protein GPJ56_008913 [Histomonas meleagridis]|uniref:uncharacterized protein n=1 Tax=Histomonas meleagridis TaxID=135588 RepID=UPI00355A6BFB|nr:hypothetical protein GPJ56_008913 [Histomonas meleagridis]KAH0797839.1 hypothetical protein GO595_009468 [Histomonas meleagridis]